MKITEVQAKKFYSTEFINMQEEMIIFSMSGNLFSLENGAI